ncbi:hypothetical protein I553_6081 [Mycobacterium xenopi 4042]|uniref:Uncharacterized protein n=1 Tax=Mycobacterium xenopi 4042 TaxID=1299334 RepID=X8BFG9_MYCXE|nr:hypothetical protein I553_6081 [Mycobacterium xenopi 4042]
MIVWNPGTGPADRHDKQIVQPFGEYLPWRAFSVTSPRSPTGRATSCPARAPAWCMSPASRSASPPAGR